MNKTVVSLLVIILVVALGAFLVNKIPTTSETPTTPISDKTIGDALVSPSTTSTDTKPVKEFTVSGKNFSFTPSTLAVNKGDTVKITFKNVEGMHDLRIDEFGVATQKIKGGAEETVEFMADKTGTFEYYCSVGSHRAMGMKGALTVK